MRFLIVKLVPVVGFLELQLQADLYSVFNFRYLVSLMKQLSVMFLEGGTNACETSQDENTKKAKHCLFVCLFFYFTGVSSQDQSL